ncbi:hypothetical protein ACWT_1229 [Actinoplanes sp. SE50]|uniref:hypothetical protein n=1 Tax=unclassified Actinoplanes TaxID=2626549 RepID=UPI00023ED3B2|nr:MULTISPECIES: hypothetical protein [unclassified Actinoplanes]AEV82246.1 hypothetical protein ACPL_1349 [Actinoplanes sp. SE50/110]ATO80644.1 hypothetical protein ACWT_1229 [Actinoplanes sp. SE50]SLL98051.1 hypothetical protein ACSP50_1268 [Actinoplanes sp. SE50/110]
MTPADFLPKATTRKEPPLFENPAVPRIRQRGSTLLVVDGDAEQDLPELPQLPGETHVTTVVVHTTVVPDIPVLRSLLNRGLAPECAAVRLVLPGAGAPGPDGWCAARHLAESLNLPVIAPDGPVIVLPDALFAFGGAWRTFRPGAEPVVDGPRHPAPRWQRTLTPPPQAEAPLRATPIPAGLWLHTADRVVAPDDPVFAVPVDPASVSLVIGRPGDPVLPAAEVAEYIRRLAPTIGDEPLLIPYGSGGHLVDELAVRLPGDAVASVRVDAGMPAVEADDVAVRTVVDAAGRAVWRPPAQQLRFQPGRAPRLLHWRPPLPHASTVGTGLQRLADGWLVEVVRCGLWIRPDREDDDAVRRIPADPDRLLLLVGAPGAPPATEVWPAVRRLLDALPADQRERVQPVLPAGTAQPSGFPAAWRLSPDADAQAR